MGNNQSKISNIKNITRNNILIDKIITLSAQAKLTSRALYRQIIPSICSENKYGGTQFEGCYIES